MANKKINIVRRITEFKGEWVSDEGKNYWKSPAEETDDFLCSFVQSGNNKIIEVYPILNKTQFGDTILTILVDYQQEIEVIKGRQ